MRKTIVRKPTKNGFEYSVSFDSSLAGKAKWFSRRHLAVFRDGIEAISMKSLCPLLGKFYFVVCGSRAGWLKRGLLGKPYTIDWNEHNFEMRVHNKNRFSLTMDGEQIALYRKMGDSWAGENRYELLFAESAADMQEFLLLLCIFIDTSFYTHRASWAIHRKETVVIVNDSNPELAEWSHPKDIDE